MKLQDRVPSKRLVERLGLDDIISVLQQNRLQWYGHVLRKEYNDWVKKCMDYEVDGARPRGRPKKTWKKIAEKDCQACTLNNKVPIGYNDAPYPPQNCPFPSGNRQPQLLASSLDPADPTPQMASRSNQPFFTIQWTDRRMDR